MTNLSEEEKAAMEKNLDEYLLMPSSISGWEEIDSFKAGFLAAKEFYKPKWVKVTGPDGPWPESTSMDEGLGYWVQTELGILTDEWNEFTNDWLEYRKDRIIAWATITMPEPYNENS